MARLLCSLLSCFMICSDMWCRHIVCKWWKVTKYIYVSTAQSTNSRYLYLPWGFPFYAALYYATLQRQILDFYPITFVLTALDAFQITLFNTHQPLSFKMWLFSMWMLIKGAICKQFCSNHSKFDENAQQHAKRQLIVLQRYLLKEAC